MNDRNNREPDNPAFTPIRIELESRIGPELDALHQISARRHLLIALRHILLYGLCAWGLAVSENPWIWIPLAALQGINILGFLILLHEHAHGLIFTRPRPVLMRLLGFVYSLPSAISPTQFRRWHLDHHRYLGSSSEDPKRANLSPKLNARWLKFLYLTPALFVIYARASAKAAADYPVQLRARIRRERLLNVAIHVGVLICLASWDSGVLFRAHLAPLFFGFPAAFMINRLGQHYAIDPERVEGWSTVVGGNPLIRFLSLNSNHHAEHHFLPEVPFYHLPRLFQLLVPYFDDKGVPNRTYRYLLWNWFVRNKRAHTSWD